MVMAHGLEVLPPFLENPNLVPMTHIRWLTTPPVTRGSRDLTPSSESKSHLKWGRATDVRIHFPIRHVSSQVFLL